ncbi:hypothetical protein Dimus_036608, partial [Dionaea muscipula]
VEAWLCEEVAAQAHWPRHLSDRAEGRPPPVSPVARRRSKGPHEAGNCPPMSPVALRRSSGRTRPPSAEVPSAGELTSAHRPRELIAHRGLCSVAARPLAALVPPSADDGRRGEEEMPVVACLSLGERSLATELVALRVARARKQPQPPREASIARARVSLATSNSPLVGECHCSPLQCSRASPQSVPLLAKCQRPLLTPAPN